MLRLLSTLLVALPFLGFGQTIPDTLTVGYAGSPPFVVGQDKPDGIAIDVWREIAFNLDLKNYVFKPYPTVNDGLAAVEQGELDMLIGPVTINAERAEKVAFSQPYLDTGYAILAPVLELGIWERLSPFFSMNFFYAILGLLFILTLVGILVWLAERKASPEAFSKQPVKGVGTGIWLALVTMTTVGYGDYSPKTITGRVIVGSWMIISLIMATSFVAGIASTLALTGGTDKTITKISQLDGKKVAVPAYGRVIERMRNVGAEPVTVNAAAKAYDLLLAGKVDAVFYDQIPLDYVFDNELKEDYVLTKNDLYPQYYGFAYSVNNAALRRKIDVALLRLKESGEMENIKAGWLGR